jgi:type II restriction enzyme
MHFENFQGTTNFIWWKVMKHFPNEVFNTSVYGELLKDCKAELIFVTSFPDRQIMRKHLEDLAWETEVWLSSDPDHLMHLNGDKFLGPYKD